MQRSEQVNELFSALAKAQGVMKGALKDHVNPHFKSRYADLSSIWEACREALSKNGLTVVQPVASDGQTVTVTTMLGHTSGQWIASEIVAVPERTGPQAMGSLVSYLRRYGLASMVGVTPEDDDAEGATDRRPPADVVPMRATGTDGTVPPTRPAETAPRSARGDGPTVFPPFGFAKSKPIAGAKMKDLEFYANAARKSLADPDKAQWHAREQTLLAAIEAEIARQRGATTTFDAPSTDMHRWPGDGPPDYSDAPPPEEPF